MSRILDALRRRREVRPGDIVCYDCSGHTGPDVVRLHALALCPICRKIFHQGAPLVER